MADYSQLTSVTPEYWKGRWIEGTNTHWHKDFVRESLKTHVSFLRGTAAAPNDPPPNSSDSSQHPPPTVFVPLCGKSLDMVWLADQGFSVVGCELSKLGVEQFLQENSISHEKYTIEGFTVYKGIDKDIKLYTGDIYNCTPDIVGHFDSIWDCDALVAVNPEERVKYVETIVDLLNPSGRILATTYEYDQSLMPVRPFCISESVMVTLFEKQCCSVSMVSCEDMTGLYNCYFLPEFKLPWANRLVFYINKKS